MRLRTCLSAGLWVLALTSFTNAQELPALPPVSLHAGEAPHIQYDKAPDFRAATRMTCPVFRVVRRVDLRERVQRIADVVGVAGPVLVTGESLGISEGPVAISPGKGPRVVSASNIDSVIRYYDFSRLWQGDAGVVLPEGEQAWNIAEQFLWAVGLGIADMKRDFVKYALAGGHRIGMTVTFKRWVNGVRVDGPGGKAYVYIGDGGHVDGLLYVCRPIEVVGVYPLRTADEALQQVEADGEALCDLPDDATRVAFDQTEVAYWEEPPHSRQDFIQPVYVLKGRAFRDGKDVGAAEVIVPAVAPSHIIGAPAAPRPR